MLIRRTLALAFAAMLTPPAPAQDPAVPEQEPFTLDLPQWNPDPDDLPPELRPLDVERPVLPDDAAGEVAELEATIEELQKTGLTAETRERQDAALDVAITLALRALEIRTAHQGNTEGTIRWRDAAGQPAIWHEVLVAQHKVEHLRLLRGLDTAARTELASLEGTDGQAERLFDAAKYADAQALVERQIAVRRRLLGDAHPDTLTSIGNLGELLRARGRPAEAEPYLRDALDDRRRVLGDEHPLTLNATSNMGGFLQTQGRLAEAEPYLRDALEGRRRILGDEHPLTLISVNNMGGLLEAQGRLAEAEPYYRQALEGRRRVLGDEHPDTLNSINSMGGLLQAQGRLTEIEPYWRQALKGRRRTLGDDHPATLISIGNMGFLLRAQGRLAEAEPYYREALEGFRRTLGDEHPLTLTAIDNMGSLLRSQGRLAQAELYWRQALEASRRARGDEHADTLQLLGNMGLLLWAQGRLAEAERNLRNALEGYRRALGNEHPHTLTSVHNLGSLLEAQGRPTEAEPYLREALEIRRRVLGNEHPETLIAIHSKGKSLHAQGHLAEAEPYYREALEGFRRALGSEHPDTLIAIHNMGRLLEAQGHLAKAEPYYREALAIAERLRVEVIGGAQERAQLAARLKLPGISACYARALLALGRDAEALSVLERGRSRAGLDLMAGGSAEAERLLLDLGDCQALARYDAALAEESAAKRALFEAEARVSKAPDDEKAEWLERVKAARVTLSEKTAAVFRELRGLVPAGEPASSDEVLAALEEDEALLSYSWTNDGVIALVARDGGVRGVTLADDKDEAAELSDAVSALRQRIAVRPSAGEPVPAEVLAAARAAALPEELRALLDGVTALTVIADGPLAGVPLETLVPETPIAYAPSATIALQQRRAAERRATRLASAVVLGDPVFAGSEPKQPDYPDTGVLLAFVQEGSNADQAGLQRGDVLLTYAEHELASAQDLGPAIGATTEALAARGAQVGERPVPARVWRDGEVLEVALATGRMGVAPSQAPPAEGLRAMAVLDRSADSLAAGAAALEQVRFYGGTLRPLPATRLEAEAVAAMLGDDVTLLLGEEATVPNLRDAIESSRPRVVHLATHGLLGSADRPLLASLALTTPDEPSPDDTGFLTLEEILGTWGAQLRGNELVVLSACDTGRGVQRGGTMMALPLGLFIAGTDTVIASLWAVDDRATALLMARFYGDWLGKTGSERRVDGARYAPGEPMPKLAALREAQAWLRTLTTADVERLGGSGAGAIADEAARGPSPPRGRLAPPAAGDDRPYDHPYYWAAFVLYGSAR